MESALYGVYTLVLYQKSHSFASLTRSFSDTPQLVCKHRTRALSMKYSIFIESYSSTKSQKVFVFCLFYFAIYKYICKISVYKGRKPNRAYVKD